jgi:cytochrome c oxidase assembly protein subunit 11
MIMALQRNTLIGGGLVAIVIGMTGLSFASVPLYRAFCAATGYAGTPQIGPGAAPGGDGGSITVAFNADVNPNLPWHFAPETHQVTFKLGDQQMAFFDAKNLSKAPITGVALYNVTPETVGHYFHKTQCFCFDSQTLKPGEAMQFPVTFWVDPAIATDPETKDVHTITLSYTFFRSLDDAARNGALANAGPHTGNPAQGRVIEPGSAGG